MNTSLTRSQAALALAAVLGVIAPQGASADEVRCGFTQAGWNAPKGAAVFSRTAGPVRDLFAAAGESRTHVMLSNGTGPLATAFQATRHAPVDTGWPGCSLEADDLRHGGPGAEQINMGGVFTGYFGGAVQPTSVRFRNASTTLLGTINGLPLLRLNGTVLANAMNNFPKISVLSVDPLGHVMPNGSYFRFLNPDITLPFPVAGLVNPPLMYAFSQFSNIAGVQAGDASNGGVACSTFLAYGQHEANLGDVRTKTYSHAQVRAGLFAITASVEGACETNSTGDFDWAYDLACFTNVCGDAANQVANCMLGQNCDDDSDNTWRAFADNPNFRTRTVSPDLLAGVVQAGTPEAPLAANSIWAGQPENDVQFNQAGVVYGCWE